jgi:hypothetical protein
MRKHARRSCSALGGGGNESENEADDAKARAIGRRFWIVAGVGVEPTRLIVRIGGRSHSTPECDVPDSNRPTCTDGNDPLHSHASASSLKNYMEGIRVAGWRERASARFTRRPH